MVLSYRDHPRRCGENFCRVCRGRGMRGSPPRMRGKLNVRHLFDKFRRITPADAGKTYCPCLSPWAAQDHPRGCGENQYANKPHLWGLGSPPRMRGKLDVIRSKNCFYRITPADAGKTALRLSRSLLIQDHPRGCGENQGAVSKRGHCLGSPPRMRGKLLIWNFARGLWGITPADAGKTCPYLIASSGHWDHPRGCGENCCKFVAVASPVGSPPRMRGKRIQAACIACIAGITPADAGKTPQPIYVSTMT